VLCLILFFGITSIESLKGNGERQLAYDRARKCITRLTQFLSNENVLEEAADFLSIPVARFCL